MKISKIIYGFLFMALATVSVVSCDEDDEATFEPLAETPKNIAELVEGNDNLATLVTALTQSDVDSILRSTTTYTFFAPQNDAFTGIDIATMSADDRDNLLLNHVIATTTPDFIKSLATGYLTTMGVGPNETNLSLFVNVDGGLAINGVANAVSGMTDIGATNGIMHVVDGVLAPPTVLSHVQANPDFSSFMAALEMASLEETLNGPELFTILAPNNAAFEAFMTTLNGAFGWSSLADIPSDSDFLQQVLTYHIIAGGNTVSGDLVGEMTTMQGEVIIIGEDGSIDDSSYTNGNTVILDIQSVNGVIHSIDKVLAPESVFQSVLSETLDIVARSSDRGYATFVTAITKVGLTGAISTDELTVFAPTDAAFESFFKKIENFDSLDDFVTDEEIELLKKVIQYHLYEGILMSSSLVDGDITTQLGDVFSVDLSGAAPKLISTYEGASEADISESNIGASNGLIHGISKVLVSDELGTVLGYPKPIVGGVTVFALPIYTDAISSEWNAAGYGNWNYNTTIDWAGVDNVKTGDNSGIVVQEDGGVWKFGQGAPGFDLSAYSELQFSAFAADAATFTVVVNGDWANSYTTGTFEGGKWNDVIIPLSAFPADFMAIETIEVQIGGGLTYPYTYYLDDMGFDASFVPATVTTYGLQVYEDAISGDWTNAGYGEWHYNTTIDWAGTDNVFAGDNSGTVVQEDGGVWKFGQGAPGFDLSAYSEFQFSAYAADAVTFTVVVNGDWANSYTTGTYDAGKWNTVVIPLSSFSSDFTAIETIEVQLGGGAAYPYTYYIDNVGFDITEVAISSAPTFALQVYKDAITDAWVTAGYGDWHYNTTVNWAGTDNINNGDNSATVEQQDGGVWKFGQGAPGFDLSAYSEFQFSAYAADAVTFTVVVNGDWANSYTTGTYDAGKWNTVVIPLSAFPADFTAIETIEVQLGGGAVYPYTYYLDDIGFDVN